MAEENDTPKVSKTEEKQSFLKDLDDRISKLKEVEESIKTLTERNEELAARNLLGGKSDAGIQPVTPKEETPSEYKNRIMSGR